MARRLHKTLIDYLVIAISPALIILLVGSLVFFLLEVCYHGEYSGRLECIFGLFVIGAVLIGRISIEDGRERAALFAVPLGIVTLLAINKFVEFQGGLLSSLSFIVNCGIVALIWWSADKLTWDCTVIDEAEEDSGEGLLEAVGLDRPDKAALQQEITPVAAEPEATTSRDDGPKGWWERFVERRRRPHAPGVWVVYFSLAALPLFGLGQLCIPSTNLATRQYAFQLLFVYTASGLALLSTTSFLGLRRYLRQRQQEMPFLMVNLWLGIGGAIIVGVMLAAMLLPRPNPEYAISKLPFHMGSPDQKASRFGKGRDGVEEDQSWARRERRDGQGQKTATDDQATSDRKKEGEKDGAASTHAESPSSEKGERSPRESSEGAEASKEPSKSEGKGGEQRADQEKGPSDSGQRSVEQPSDNRNGASDGAPLRAFQPPGSSSDVAAMLLSLIKWILYGVLAAVALVWLWMSRDRLASRLNQFIQAILDFWRGLFGGSGGEGGDGADETSGERSVRRRFADFTDPFSAGTAGSYRPEELVRYTFEALEAWARDRGHPREPEQTPHEFAHGLVEHAPTLAGHAAQLADLYCHAAYAPGTLPAAAVAGLSRLWLGLSCESSALDTNGATASPQRTRSL